MASCSNYQHIVLLVAARVTELLSLLVYCLSIVFLCINGYVLECDIIYASFENKIQNNSRAGFFDMIERSCCIIYLHRFH